MGRQEDKTFLTQLQCSPEITGKTQEYISPQNTSLQAPKLWATSLRLLVPHFPCPTVPLGSLELPMRTLQSLSSGPGSHCRNLVTEEGREQEPGEDWAPVPLAGGPGGRRQVHTAVEARPGRQEGETSRNSG